MAKKKTTSTTPGAFGSGALETNERFGNTRVYSAETGKYYGTNTAQGQYLLGSNPGGKGVKKGGNTRAMIDSYNSSLYTDNKTGDVVRAGDGTPVSNNGNYTKSGRGGSGLQSQNLMQGRGDSANLTGGYRGQQLPQTPGSPVTKFAGTPLGGFGYSQMLQGLSTGAGQTGTTAGSEEATSATTGTSGYYGNILGGASFTPSTGGRPMTSGFGSGSPFGNAQQLGQKSMQGALQPEQIAGSQLATSLGGADTDLQNAYQDYGETSNFLGQSYEQGSQMLGQAARTGYGQADRAKEEGLAENEIEKQKAELEYNAALETITTNRESENDYLMQKLASAGAIDSTAGVQIISKSAQKYDSIIGQLAGQRQIALSGFALADSKVRNQFVSTIENITTQAQQLSFQLTQDFQSQMLSAKSTLRGAKGTASKANQQAYTDYMSTLYGIQEAKAEASAASQAAALEAQQQAFDNAVTMGNLTGTYTDPFTGETIRTLNGMKFDAEMAAASGSGGGSGTMDSSTYGLMVQQAQQMGIIDQSQANGLLLDLDKDSIAAYGSLLQDQITKYGANPVNSWNNELGTSGWSTGLSQSISNYYGLGGLGYNPQTFPYNPNKDSYTIEYDKEGNVTGHTQKTDKLPEKKKTTKSSGKKDKTSLWKWSK